MSKYRAVAPLRANTASSIRGKISAPIPIPDDEEFPIRTPGTGIATPLVSDGIDKQLRSPHNTGIAVSDFSELRAPSTQRSYVEGPTPPRHVLQKTMRNSQVSQPTDGSSVEKPQRKKTTLKSVLGRLFGTRKGRRGDSRASTANTARIDQHLSDPSALNRSKTEPPSQNRSVSLPINEYNRALRSHSPFTETFPLQNPSENRNSTLAERRARTRRATTPSRLFDAPLAEQIENGLAPRPASSHARDSRLLTDDGERFAIGCAVTSGSHPHRRSRSLDGLRQAVAHAQSNTRRRSDEIRYWRQSHDVDALSPISSTKAEQELQVIAQHGEHSRGEAMERAEESVAPQPFNFGPMGEMAGMKITEAASLETRVKRMEKKMQQMEKIILQVQGLSVGSGSNMLDSQKRGNSMIGTTADESSEYSLPRRVDRFRAKESERSSSYSRPSTVDTQNSTTESSEGRPLSTSTTIRGLPSSSPPLPSDKAPNQLSGERYNKLVSFVTSEQQARLRLEAIVDRLQVQLREQIRVQSSRPTSLTTHHPNAPLLQYSQPYPTPSPEDHALLQQSQNVPRSAFEADDSSSDEEGNPDDVFQTPSEEVGHYDMNPGHDYSREEDVDERDGKRAVRITSLSQLTLGKGRGGLQSVNF